MSSLITPDPEKLLEAALRLASLEIEVLPCNPNGYYANESDKKAPHGLLVPHGVSEATTDEQTIRNWWRQCPTANIGIKAGDNLLIIDVDCKDGADGYADLAAMEAALGALPATPYATTPSGGRHYFFRVPVLPKGVRFKGRAKIVFDGRQTSIDLRIGNQYVLAAPSMVNDKEYSFPENGGLALNDDGSLNVARLPDEWIKVLPKHVEAASQLGKPASKPASSPPVIHSPARADVIRRCRRYVQKLPPAIEGANGSGDCYHTACVACWDFGLSELEGRPILDEFNTRCIPPWNDAELRHKIADALDPTGKTKPRGWRLIDSQATDKPTGEIARGGGEAVLESIELGDVDLTPAKWLWYRRIQVGEITTIAGFGGAGKSTFAAYVASVITQDTWGFYGGGKCLFHGEVKWITTEASERNIRSHIEAAGGDYRRVHVSKTIKIDAKRKRIVQLADVDLIDRDLNERAQSGRRVRLIVIDPVGSFFGSKANSHNDAEVRPLLEAFAELARKHELAVILIAHFNKGTSHTSIENRVMGSAAFTTVARNVLYIMPDPEDHEHVRVAAGKANECKKAGVLRFTFKNMILPTEGVDISAIEFIPDDDAEGNEPSIPLRSAQRCEWLPAEDGDERLYATELETQDKKKIAALERANRPPKDNETSRAGDFLDSIFKDGKAVVEAKEVERQWEGREGNKSTLQRPRVNKGIKATRVTLPDKAQFSVWHLPSVKVTADGIATTDAGEVITITRYNSGYRTVKRPVPKED